MKINSKKAAKSLILMLMVFTLLVTNVGNIVYADNTNSISGDSITVNTPTFGSEPADPKKVKPIKPNSVKDQNASNTDTIVISNGSPATSDGNITTLSSEAPSYIHYSLTCSDDLRTITFSVNLINCYTPMTNFEGFINIYNYQGVCTSSTRVWGSMIYQHTWTITKPITSTVEETIRLQGGSVTQSLQTFSHPPLSEIRTNQIGGSYGSIINAMGGDRHHCFAAENYSYATVYKYDVNRNITGTVSTWTAPCILMTPEDHRNTKSWGNSTTAQQYRADQLALVRQGKYLAAMQMDIRDIKSKFGSKYDNAISQMVVYATSLGWYQ
ncbi:MAG: hypothetical protein N2645_21620 [Clostridia bacterium]|nr:hypothetical protein [Clostridia bacterium]